MLGKSEEIECERLHLELTLTEGLTNERFGGFRYSNSYQIQDALMNITVEPFFESWVQNDISVQITYKCLKIFFVA